MYRLITAMDVGMRFGVSRTCITDSSLNDASSPSLLLQSILLAKLFAGTVFDVDVDVACSQIRMMRALRS
jgi:hypothetical protein